MKLIFSYLDDAYNFTPREKQIIIKLLDFFKDYIPQGNGYFLHDLNLNKIKFNWCPEMAIPQSDSNGAWFIFNPNSIYIKPATQAQAIYNLAKKNISKNNQNYNEYNQIINFKEILNKQKTKPRMISKNKKNEEDLIFLDHIIGQNVLSTIFHELYHKWQCEKTYYVIYIVNMLIGMIYGYYKSAQNEWFIQGDVRKYIDVPQLHQAIRQFYSYFNTYVNTNAFIINNQKQFFELTIKSYLTSQQQSFIERYQDSIFIINDYKNSYNKLKKFVFQLCKFCEQI